MLQERKSRSCGISAIFFQCCFMIETQILMTVSDFSGFFSRNHFLEGGLTFQWGVCLSVRGRTSFLSGRGGWALHGGIGFDGAPSPCPPPHYGKPWRRQQVWGQVMVQRAQKKALRNINFKEESRPNEPLFTETKILNLTNIIT